ncbi:outer membrane lipoprotein carrier protein LolA [Hymenobacter sp. ASUV-10]|uniref:Outer membrane lipoprotein carrier protein LolA n=1 Tax=Hymenobacter aranciens TaxID=3063996 RepID=A0ABT9B5V9_9BACT|nr:outer membrane lipoprotein carrier protein LolA [Hymenobacter sp. ASUV-10]MDO7873652.1 outer membrane lipoprotein carrier protein LolA [Hymenobacter sp. ASUV-10]
MTKTLSLLLLSATLALPAVAQQDPKAGKILDAMSTKYQAYKSYQADFTQTLENTSAKVKQNLSGNIIVAGQKFRLKLSGQEVINDGKTTWTYLKNENEVNISDTDPDAQDMSPSQIYTMYKKGYKYTYAQAATEAGEAIDVIELTPESRTNDVFKVRIKVRKKDNSVKSWEMFKKNGNRYTFTIKNFKPNVPVTASTFSFDKAKYKGVKVVDLR